jgi:hypothetical protein
MTKTIAVASVLMLGTVSFAVAQNRSESTSPSASQYSPGREMQNSTTNSGMRDKGTIGQSKGASEYLPRDRMYERGR